ncbi:MAG: SAM-dependent DNA methyltransferase [Ruminococcus sp.]|nr:SAM-dependent DNA methyltransferase [Ruminococcus sp.]
MKDTERRLAAKEFAEYWKDKGYEKGESQKFWLSLLQDVLGVSHPEQFITFEEQVKLDHTSFIDAYIPATHVLIEQKGKGKDLQKPIKQSDGTLLTPFEQARRYSAALPYSQRPRWIVACNFEQILVYDMEKPNSEPELILLKNLPKEYYRLQFLVDTGDENIHREMEVSVKAGKLVGVLYDEILKQYHNPEDPKTLQSLNMLCVRLVFCLYAEDAGVFGGHNKFHNYINSFPARDMRRALIELFRILDTKDEDRDAYEDELLTQFPYVNGGLFASSDIEIPQFNDKIREILLKNASAEFDWSDISPTIFGAVFESTLNPETRRSGGMHYTSIENIHKVIDPLFLDELRDELAEIKEIKSAKTREKKIDEYRNKLASLTFLDPACGSGNFLTETYISLRRLENEALKTVLGDQIVFDTGDVIRVSIGQFYGIEINDFAVTVAKTALWIAESQMMKETESIVHKSLNFLPLKSYANIIEANALRIDWEEVVPKEKLNYIMGNPPFVGYAYQSSEQKTDLTFTTSETAKNMDYVAGWYFKACNYIIGTTISCAFVSTNSITQGEQVAVIWKPLYEKYNVHIDFAYRTFRWDSEASQKAHVHCVIVGFSVSLNNKSKILYENDRFSIAKNINAYLVDADNVFIESRIKPICSVPIMSKGSQPTDGGNLIITENEYSSFLEQEPKAIEVIKLFLGGEEFIKGKRRYCLWLAETSPKLLREMPAVIDRIEKVRKFREKSKKAATRKWANFPSVFTENRQPTTNFIAIPEVSSENRRYVPVGFLTPDVICSNKLQLIPNANRYHFGVLTSNVHMAWMRSVCGRLETRYDYSAKIVYNNFPWPEPTEQQKAEIEKTAQAILEARELYPDCSLADLYDELTMPPELRKAHQANDKAVMRAYGFKKDLSESAIVAELMKMYQELTS